MTTEPSLLRRLVRKLIHTYPIFFIMADRLMNIQLQKKALPLCDHSLPVADDWLQIGKSSVISRNCLSSLVHLLPVPVCYIALSLVLQTFLRMKYVLLLFPCASKNIVAHKDLANDFHTLYRPMST